MRGFARESGVDAAFDVDASVFDDVEVNVHEKRRRPAWTLTLDVNADAPRSGQGLRRTARHEGWMEFGDELRRGIIWPIRPAEAWR